MLQNHNRRAPRQQASRMDWMHFKAMRATSGCVCVCFCVDIQSNVKSPKQGEQLHHQVDDEPSVVPLPHAVLDPRTVVVKAANAAITHLAVLRSHWLLLTKTQRGAKRKNKVKHIDLEKTAGFLLNIISDTVLRSGCHTNFSVTKG